MSACWHVALLLFAGKAAEENEDEEEEEDDDDECEPVELDDEEDTLDEEGQEYLERLEKVGSCGFWAAIEVASLGGEGGIKTQTITWAFHSLMVKTTQMKVTVMRQTRLHWRVTRPHWTGTTVALMNTWSSETSYTVCVEIQHFVAKFSPLCISDLCSQNPWLGGRNE